MSIREYLIHIFPLLDPVRQDVYEQAFVHRSYLNEHKDSLASYETLEFLGDSVLSLITSEYLFTSFPELHEGDYTDAKAAIVRTESLADAARKLAMQPYIKLSSGEDAQDGRNNDNILADIFESTVGAIFLDKGFEMAKTFVHTHLFQALEVHAMVSSRAFVSPKNRLQELLQKTNKTVPHYETIAEDGPEHKKTFTVAVSLQGKELGRAVGKSKKQAEEAAARIALNLLENTP